VLAEDATMLEDIDRAAVEVEMRTAREDLAEAKDDATRDRLEQAIAVSEAKIAVLDNPVY
jgi:F-type H+-transporting ATPase subunit epsilon